MRNLHRITNKRFEQNVYDIAKAYGFKTVGATISLLEKTNINAKWCFGTSHIRSGKLLRILQEYRR